MSIHKPGKVLDVPPVGKGVGILVGHRFADEGCCGVDAAHTGPVVVRVGAPERGIEIGPSLTAKSVTAGTLLEIQLGPSHRINLRYRDLLLVGWVLQIAPVGDDLARHALVEPHDVGLHRLYQLAVVRRKSAGRGIGASIHASKEAAKNSLTKVSHPMGAVCPLRKACGRAHEW